MFVLFFLMIRRPPRSTLFPYTTPSDLALARPRPRTSSEALRPESVIGSPSVRVRSEEHTSELQSRQYLVCRLLLEKKINYTHMYAAIELIVLRCHFFSSVSTALLLRVF